jgi:hypothetical protein
MADRICAVHRNGRGLVQRFLALKMRKGGYKSQAAFLLLQTDLQVGNSLERSI